MTAPALIRPQKVTFACIFVGVSSLIMLFSIGSTLSNWGSIELREQIASLLADDPFRGAGLETGEVLGWLRWVLMAGAAVAVTGIILAIWTAKGHQPSRIILTFMCGLASLLFLAGGIWGILPAAFAIGCGFYLWSSEARVWFAVKNGKASPSASNPPPGANAFATPAIPTGFETQTASTPAPTESLAYPAEAGAPPLIAAQVGRPKSALVAALVAICASGLVTFVCGVNAIAYLAAPDAYVTLLEDQPVLLESGVLAELGMSTATFAKAIFVVSAAIAILAIAAIAAAILVIRGSKAGRVALLVLSAITVPLSILMFPVGLPWTAAAVTVIVCLLKADAKAWFAAR